MINSFIKQSHDYKIYKKGTKMKKIIKEKDASFGIIPLQKNNEKWQVFIVRSITGHWGFPKGHPDSQYESPQQTAQRELKEETGFTLVSYYPIEALSFSYECRSHGRYVDKTVTLYLGQVTGNIHPCPIEIAESIWVDLDKVEDYVVFGAIQDLLKTLKKIVKEQL